MSATVDSASKDSPSVTATLQLLVAVSTASILIFLDFTGTGKQKILKQGYGRRNMNA
jgi:hypothetical protein